MKENNRQSIKWHQLTDAEVVRRLQSNASCGLSCKEAYSRLRRGGANTLFDGAHGLSAGFRLLLTDPALLILGAVSLLALLFSELSVAIPALAVLICWLIPLIRLYGRLRRRREQIQKGRIPTLTVLRDGKHFRASARNLVRGDIIFLRAGDVVPADCRLLRCDRLRTRLLLPAEDAEGKPERYESSKDAATVYPYGSEVYAPRCENMIYGGSELLCGSCTAIVVETAHHSFLGAMGSKETPSSRSDAALFRHLNPYLRLFGFCMLLWMLPVSVLGLILSPQELGAFRIFLPICVLTASASSAYLMSLFRLFAEEKQVLGKAGAAIGKTEHARDRLPYMTDLILLGHAALSDGVLHYAGAINGEGLLLPEEKGSRLTALSEAFSLLEYAGRHKLRGGISPREPYRRMTEELNLHSGYDKKALEIRNPILCAVSDPQDAVFDVETREEHFRLRFTQRYSAVFSCTEYMADPAKRVFFSRESKNQLHTVLQPIKESGMRVLFVIREEAGRQILVGGVMLRERVLPQASELLEHYAEMGVRVKLFLPKESPSELFFAEQCGIPKSKLCRPEAGASLAEPVEKHTCFLGFSREEISAYITSLRKNGRTVAVFSNEMADRPLLSRASLQICAADSDPKHRLLGYLEPIDASAGGCAEVIRRDADLQTATVSEAGGGLAALISTFASSRGDLCRAKGYLRLAASLQLLRVSLCTLSLLTGSGILPAYAWLLLSLFFDLAVFLRVRNAKVSASALAAPIPMDEGWLRGFFKNLKRLRLPLIPAAFAWLLLLVGKWTELISPNEGYPFLYFFLLLTQLLLLLFDGEQQTELVFSTQRTVLLLCSFLIPSAAALLLSILFEPVDHILELGAWSLPSGIGLLLSILVSLLCCILFLKNTLEDET